MLPADTEPTPAGETRYVTYGPLTVDIEGFTVAVAGRDVPLTFSEFLLFKTLLLNPNQVLSREVLQEVLGNRQLSYRQRWNDTGTRTIDIHMSRIRRKLARAGFDCIRTMRFVGYRFVPPEAPAAP